ncbi:hypothetical protein [Falsibacillus albus]|uniref:Uncharacterized protein n=1 Tax=Falsibacillus albus TaxID=2478915 RepID=A0A3L7JNE8_9BACI|nr:hypothetical protein [Falsibacillus albus]RLQ92303.1 hypothetical protein D9X91_19705 [Falsibacillus albus]
MDNAVFQVVLLSGLLRYGKIKCYIKRKRDRMTTKSERKKLIVWGIVTMVVIAPILSFLLGIIFGVIVRSGFAAGGVMVIVFLITFLVGLITLISGLSKKESVENDN